ncbi:MULTISPECIES: hypothetical protein [unclassified Pseudomonas]|uniref:hypothetical protein n=1 Tax=unclassified Pseudomonas TaxID=196821 RepID=UPI000F035182|nr:MULTISPECIES: hypothetical protein [unclassified Pseudomonas]MBD8602178.1 hypothetical protein [Pseudomonas sp. CFBP 8771]MBD8730783.1 hypothetical protein [Pseudomonas sp. CFBP 13710]MBD8828299.1 hypothetical protein [Pseudomonas sp. CFBP 13602]
MYQQLPSFVLGFHGCDREIGEAVLAGDHIAASVNDYDWLGRGAYFWENSPERAFSYAEHISKYTKRGKGWIKHPYVIGAVIDLKLCLNLTDEGALEELRGAYEILVATSDEIPINRPGFNADQDNLLRHLDCAVFMTLHEARDSVGLPEYASVRSPFLEGPQLYPGTFFRKQTHVQLCIRDASCIKGYFLPRNSDGSLFQP